METGTPSCCCRSAIRPVPALESPAFLRAFSKSAMIFSKCSAIHIMKIEKSGYYKNKGFTRLVVSALQAGKPLYRGVPTWRENTWEMFILVKGLEGQSTYDYDLTFSGAELALMVEA